MLDRGKTILLIDAYEGALEGIERDRAGKILAEYLRVSGERGQMVARKGYLYSTGSSFPSLHVVPFTYMED